MISKTQSYFWDVYNSLPVEIQSLAKEKFDLWKNDSFNSSLQFKPLYGNIWSVRINQNYRALGRRQENLIVWFWIGNHSDYDQLLKRLK